MSTSCWSCSLGCPNACDCACHKNRDEVIEECARECERANTTHTAKDRVIGEIFAARLRTMKGRKR